MPNLAPNTSAEGHPLTKHPGRGVRQLWLLVGMARRERLTLQGQEPASPDSGSELRPHFSKETIRNQPLTQRPMSVRVKWTFLGWQENPLTATTLFPQENVFPVLKHKVTLKDLPWPLVCESGATQHDCLMLGIQLTRSLCMSPKPQAVKA